MGNLGFSRCDLTPVNATVSRPKCLGGTQPHGTGQSEVLLPRPWSGAAVLCLCGAQLSASAVTSKPLGACVREYVYT